MKIAVLPGDGIGPEIMAEAMRVLDYFIGEEALALEIEVAPLGAQAYFDQGDPFPPLTKAVCDSADVILKGPVGLNHSETQLIPLEFRPERGAILPLRKRYDTFANYRPVRLSEEMKQFSPLKNALLCQGVDFVIVRELVGGLYFGEKSQGINRDGLRYVRETLEYDEYIEVFIAGILAYESLLLTLQCTEYQVLCLLVASGKCIHDSGRHV